VLECSESTIARVRDSQSAKKPATLVTVLGGVGRPSDSAIDAAASKLLYVLRFEKRHEDAEITHAICRMQTSTAERHRVSKELVPEMRFEKVDR
jgi:hypothetical protein